MLRLLRAALEDFNFNEEDSKISTRKIEMSFLFAMLWGFGGAIENRKSVDLFFKKACSGDLTTDPKLKRRIILPDRNLFDYGQFEVIYIYIY